MLETSTPAQPDTIPFRLFVTQLLQMIANLKANPDVRNTTFKDVSIHAIMQTPLTQLELLKEIIPKAAEINMEVMPGFRLMETNAAPLGYMDPVRWQRNADYLLALADAVPVRGRKVVFDQEDYQSGTIRAPSVEAQAIPMKPFIDAVKATGIIPCVYPAFYSYHDVLVLGDAVCGNIELWTETVFDLSERVRLGNAEGGMTSQYRAQTGFLNRWPNCVVRHGAYDHLLRSFGHQMRQRMSDYGPKLPWIFDAIRKDNAQIGLPKWITAETRDTSNDVSQAWVMGPYATGHVQTQIPTGMTLSSTPLPGFPSPIRADVKYTSGYILTGGKCLKASNAIPTTGDFSVACEVILPPTGSGPIMGSNQSNHESWQVIYDETVNQIVLELRQPNVTATNPLRKVSTVVIDAPTKGVPIRILISKLGTGWLTQASTTPFVAPLTVNNPGGHLYIGAGSVMGFYTQTFFEGLIVKNAEVLRPVLTAVERVSVVAKGYPRLP